jgi:hypothetical protein
MDRYEKWGGKMKRNLPVVTLVLVILVLVAGCATNARSTDLKVLADAKKIALVKYREAESWYFVDIGSLHRADAWLVNAFTETSIGDKSFKFTKEINAKLGSPNLEKDFNEALTRLLEEKGCDVRIVALPRDKSGKPILSGISPTEFDAVIDIAFKAGYFAFGPTTDYRRAAQLDLNVYSVSDNRLTFNKALSPKSIARKGEPRAFQYKDFDELMANSVAAFGGLREFVVSVTVPLVANTLR